MNSNDMAKVVIIGGGIGGLCLAQGLRGAGIDVSVHERDAAPASRAEGYRIHINPAGARALRACLPERLWSAFLATSGSGGEFGFLTEQLRRLLVVEESIMYPDADADPAEGHYAADRATLRRLLRAGLDGCLHFGAEFERYERLPDGRIRAIFADGREAVGDVLVGADGIGSRVRKQYLPQAERVDAGAVGIANKVWLDKTDVPGRLGSGMNLMMTNAPYFLFTSVYRPPADSSAVLTDVDGGSPPDTRPYLLCALTAHPKTLPDNLTELDGNGLRAVLDTLAAGWHPELRRMLAESDQDSRTAMTFGAAAPIAAWPSSNVTLLGDAIHSMPPVGGLGGNTALRDAHLLSLMLCSVRRGEREVLPAIGYYERETREYGFAAVRNALSEKDRAFSTGALGMAAARTWFRLCDRRPALRRRSFGEGWIGPARPREWELHEQLTLA